MIRLSTTFDWWKKSCHGVTVAPAMRDDEEHAGGGQAPVQPGDEATGECQRLRPARGGERDHEHVDEHEREHDPLEAAEAARRRRREQRDRDERDDHVPVDAEEPGREIDADELRDDREQAEHEQVEQGEPAPATSEPLVDQTRVAGAGDRPETRDHLLVDKEHRRERQQEPDERGAVVLTCLTVDGDAAGLVVADHDDDAGAHDREQGREPADPAPPRRGVVARNRPEAALDVAAVGAVDRRATLDWPQKRADRNPAAALLGQVAPRHQGRPV